MKCQFLIDVEVNPAAMLESEKAKVEFRTRPGSTKLEPYFPTGTIYETDKAEMFVRSGMAVPADDECREVCADLTPANLADLQHRFRRLDAGIAEEDREMFDAGAITGYNPDGSYRQGPNWDKWTVAKAAAEAQVAAKDDI